MAYKNNNGFLDTIVKCQKEYDKNLKNKKVMFIVEDKNKKLSKIEVFFGEKNFYHLTGLIALDKEGKELSPHNFYSLLNNGRIDELKLERRDNTADLKLRVLPQLMRIDRMATMVGDFTNYSMFLQTHKLAGNTNACMGFIHDTKLDIYVPNTALQKDIRDITTNRNKIVAIFKKEVTQNLYTNITYLKQNYSVRDVLQNIDIIKNIDIENIYSADKLIDKKIYEFIYNHNEIEEETEKINLDNDETNNEEPNI